MQIRQASLAGLDLLVPLFDAYRQFYRKPADLEGARRFLTDRMARQEAVIFLALDGVALGFTLLFPSFSSGSMARIFVLNDLFVAPEARGRGVGSALLKAAADYARNAGAVRMTLQTEITNTTAQSVYERLGWKRDTVFYSYQLEL